MDSICTIESMTAEPFSYETFPSLSITPQGIGSDTGSISSLNKQEKTPIQALKKEHEKTGSDLLTKGQKEDADYLMKELVKVTTSKLPGTLGRTSVLLSMLNGSMQPIIDSPQYQRLKALQRPFYILDYALNHPKHCKDFERILKDYGKEILGNQERQITEAYQALKSRQPYYEHIQKFCSKFPIKEETVLQKMENKEYHGLLIEIFKKHHEIEKASKKQKRTG